MNFGNYDGSHSFPDLDVYIKDEPTTAAIHILEGSVTFSNGKCTVTWAAASFH
jgi:hypothetical protein